MGASAFVKYLAINGFPYAERRVQHGALDEGDITGTPCLTFEVTNRNKYAIRQWLKEANAEKANARADYCPLIIKPVGVGLTKVADWWAVLPVVGCLDVSAIDVTDGFDALTEVPKTKNLARKVGNHPKKRPKPISVFSVA